jgi:hypothetical protein
MGRLFKPTFWHFTLSTPKRCHMDLWSAQLVLTSSSSPTPFLPSPGVRVSNSFLALSFETLGLHWASTLLDLPPPPDHLENHLMWVDTIKVIPLACCRMSFELLVVNYRLLSWHYHCNHGSRLALHWDFESMTPVPLKRQRSPRQYIQFHMFSIQAKQGCNCQFRNHKDI